MSLIFMLNIAILSIPNPHAITGMSIPSGFVISGLNIPDPPSSIHPISGCFANNSADGSVNGKYAGLILIWSVSANSSAKLLNNPFKCPKFNFSPSTIPSV